MPDESAQAYNFALEVAKQLITLSTAIIGLTVTFSKEVFRAQPRLVARVVLVLSWVCYLASIWFGVNHIQALTGSLEWAAIERSAHPGSAVSRLDSAAAYAYLDSATPDAEQDAARLTLASRGVIVGEGAKHYAVLQLGAFVAATSLVVLFGVLMLLLVREPSSTERKRERPAPRSLYGEPTAERDTMSPPTPHPD